MTDDQVNEIGRKLCFLADKVGNPEPTEQPFLKLPTMLSKRQFVMSVADVQSSKTKTVSLKDAVGQVSADVIRVCPPGYPYLFYGEIISKSTLLILGPEFKIEIIE